MVVYRYVDGNSDIKHKCEGNKMSVMEKLLSLGANRELVESVLSRSSSVKPTVEYLRLLELSEKYDNLGFSEKAQQLKHASKLIRPALNEEFLWVNIPLEKIDVHAGSFRFNYTFAGVLLHNKQSFWQKWRKAMILVPSAKWIGDVPESLLDFALSTKNLFTSLYVATIVEGKYHNVSGIYDHSLREKIMGHQDPVLLGSPTAHISRGTRTFAVLGVWGKDWHELDFNCGQNEL